MEKNIIFSLPVSLFSAQREKDNTVVFFPSLCVNKSPYFTNFFLYRYLMYSSYPARHQNVDVTIYKKVH